MILERNEARHTLGIPEIIAVLLLTFTRPAHASLAPDWRSIGTLEVLSVAGRAAPAAELSGYLPLRFETMSRPVYFSVDPSMKTLLISREFIAEHDLWEYKFEREIQLPQAGGGYVPGDLVRFYVLVVGSRALKDVQAIICDDCGEVAGKSLLDRL